MNREESGEKSMYEVEIALLRQFVAAYDGWPHNPECVSVSDTLRSAISALNRLGEIEMKAMYSAAGQVKAEPDQTEQAETEPAQTEQE